MGFVTIWTYAHGHPVAVEMPAVTTAAHAALRLAEAVGLSRDDGPYTLMGTRERQVIPDQELMADWHGREVVLMKRREG